MRSVVFFNNKGGVGKTTLACNMASHIALDADQRVLVIDLDPQCNATQLLLDDAQWESIYANREKSTSRTVLRALRHIRAGDSSVDTELDVVPSTRFGVDVLPGHPSLSMVEDVLSTSWVDFRGGVLGGARRSLWVQTLISSTDYDLVVLDVGPSLGALNRTALLGSDCFVTPMSADLFSLYALDNIGDWIATWTREYRRAAEDISASSRSTGLPASIPLEAGITRGYLGYTVQQYVTKAMGDSTRTVNSYERYRKQIPARAETLNRFSFPGISNHDLGLVPNMFSMVPLAQAAHAPIRRLTSSDGVRGAQASQQSRYISRLQHISDAIIKNLGIGSR